MTPAARVAAGRDDLVGRRIELSRDRAWGADTPLTRLVAIAHGATLDGDHLSDLFQTCVAEPATPQSSPAETSAQSA